MSFMRTFLVLILASVAACHGHSFRLRTCPKVKVMKDFDMEKFVGEWFVIGRFNPLSTCIKLQVDKSPEDVFSVYESSRPFGINFGYERGPRKGRKMTILSNNTNAVFKVEQTLTHFGLKTFGVVDTDYTNYAVVWGCDPLMVGSVRNLDILYRKPEADVDVVKEATLKAEKAGIDVRPLEKVNHRHCENVEDDSKVEKDDGLNNMFTEE